MEVEGWERSESPHATSLKSSTAFSRDCEVRTLSLRAVHFAVLFGDDSGASVVIP